MEISNNTHNDQLLGEMSGGQFARPMRVLDAILYYNLQQADRQELIRSLLSFQKWFAPLDLYTYQGRTYRNFEQTIVLSPEHETMGDEIWIFTHEQAAEAAAMQRPSLGTFVGGISGAELFRTFPPRTKTVRINPHSTPKLTLTLTGDDLYETRMWTSVVVFEDNFAEWQQTGKPDRAAFNSFVNFYVFNHSTGPIITLPNRSGMSNPAAAFTAPDCAREFLSKIDEKLRGQMEAMKVSPRDLIGKRQTLGIDGLIFNVYGPGATYALSFDVLDPDGSPSKRIENAFIVLYFLAGIDGRIDEREIVIIADFLKRQAGALNFDPRQTMSKFDALDGEARLNEYNRALIGLKTGTNAQERSGILRFACDLAVAGGSISEREKSLFQSIAHTLEIDLQKFFEQMGILAAPPSPPPDIPGLKFMPDPLTSFSPPVPERTKDLRGKVNEGNVNAWTLGNMFSLYAIAAAQADAAMSALYFQKAQAQADAMNLTIVPLVAMSESLAAKYIRTNEYLLNGEGTRLAVKMDEIYAAPVSDYFLMIVKCRLFALLYNPSDVPGRNLGQSALTKALSHRHRTVIPEEYFQQLILSVQNGVPHELMIGVIGNFYGAVGKFLNSRLTT